jgi:hypothetical protein
MPKKVRAFHIGVAAEAIATAQFARVGWDVSVQYGANQPEYDLMIARDAKVLKVSVKGSQDGSWGLTQSYLKSADYNKAVDSWLSDHGALTIFCFVQFKDVQLDALPRVYLATPAEVAERLKSSAGGRGDTILYEDHAWTSRAAGRDTVDRIPETWRFSETRLQELSSRA